MTKIGAMIPVIVESPYAGNVKRNEAYARACLKDSLKRGEAPFASHLLYTQPGIFDDTVSKEREWGIRAGFAWLRGAERTVVYTDYSITPGMQYGIDHASEEGRPVEHRMLFKNDEERERWEASLKD